MNEIKPRHVIFRRESDVVENELLDFFAYEGESISYAVLFISTKSGSPKFMRSANICFNASMNRCKPIGPFASFVFS